MKWLAELLPIFSSCVKNFENLVDNRVVLYYTTLGIEAWLSLVERCVRDAEAASSNLVASIEGLMVKRSRRRPLTA